METNKNIIHFICSLVAHIITENHDAITSRSKMLVRKNKVSLVKNYTSVSFYNPMQNMVVTQIQEVKLYDYEIPKDSYSDAAFTKLSSDMQLVKQDNSYFIALLEGDIILSHGNGDLNPNPFGDALSLNEYNVAVRAIIKKDLCLIQRNSPGGRAGDKTNITEASVDELHKIKELIKSLLK